MRRRPGLARRLLAVLLAGPAFAGGVAEAREFEDLSPEARRSVTEAAREYFDPEVDAWRGRKAFRAAIDDLAAGGDDALRDLDLMQGILYQGRSFDPEFTDERRRDRNRLVSLRREGPYVSVVTSTQRFTYALPASYGVRDVPGKGRPPPSPLLFVLHDPADRGAEQPGEAVLSRRWPAADFPGVHAGWMRLAPVAPSSDFVAADGTVPQALTTQVFAEFWKRYHVDFDRVVLDGGDAALAVAAAQPVFFAGLVLRGGRVDPAVVRNFASVPAYVVGDAALAEDLRAAGHPDVTLGDSSSLPNWLDRRRRVLPTSFRWCVSRTDQVLAHWVEVVETDPAAGERTLEVEADRETNRVSLRARGIRRVDLHLNDRIVDLDREVEVVVNGEPWQRRRLERDLDALLDRDSIRIRKSRYLGWLFPAGAWPVMTEATPPAEPAPVPGADRPAGADGVRELLLGRPDLAAQIADRSTDPAGRFLSALVRLWWRPDPGADPAAWARDAAAAEGLMGERWRWLLAGGRGPYPAPADGTAEPHRILTALVRDRIRREAEGRAGLPGEGPLAAAAADPDHGATVGWFLEEVMGPAYRGPMPEPDSPSARVYADARPRGRVLAVAGLLGLLGLAGLAAWRLRRPRTPASPPRA